MLICPKYRLRLFISADLVGSTAYKGGSGKEVVKTTARQRWVDETRHFYREFPKYLHDEFDVAPLSGGADEGKCPEIWKTVGDEIIFCARLEHTQHLGRCIWSFIKTLERYSKYLENERIELDVKGVAWTAAFPVPNVTVPIALKHSEHTDGVSGLQDHEPTEIDADDSPSSFEFLGKDIDGGFRVSKHASSDKFALSLETAYLLAQLCAKGEYSFPFTYAGRESMKGVIGNRPYPVLAIDTERREFRRQVQAYEQAISGERNAEPHLLVTFLDAFMKDERIELPALQSRGKYLEDEDLPQTYKDFREIWLSDAKEDGQRTIVEKQAEGAEEVQEPDSASLAAIEKSAEELFRRFKEPG